MRRRCASRLILVSADLPACRLPEGPQKGLLRGDLQENIEKMQNVFTHNRMPILEKGEIKHTSQTQFQQHPHRTSRSVMRRSWAIL